MNQKTRIQSKEQTSQTALSLIHPSINQPTNQSISQSINAFVSHTLSMGNHTGLGYVGELTAQYINP